MSVGARLRGQFVSAYLGARAESVRHGAGAFRDRLRGRAGVATLYFAVDEPSSVHLAEGLADLVERYGLPVRVVVVPTPDADVDPEPQLRAAFERADASAIATLHGLDELALGEAPSDTRVRRAQAIALHAESAPNALARVVAVGRALLAGEGATLRAMAESEGAVSGDAVRPALESRYASLRKAGHYRGGVVAFGGDFYQGVDRLHLLEGRLRARGADEATPRFPAPGQVPLAIDPTPREITLFFSFRSPYSYVALERVAQAIEGTEITLRLRPVLPMVMRGLPVPSVKRLYIARDAAREARALGIPFGKIVDPLGEGVERALAITLAQPAGARRLAVARRFARAIWSEAADLTEGKTLVRIASEVTLDEASVDAALADDAWRTVVESNRRTMIDDLGLWGVPCFESGELQTWGQDRVPLVLAHDGR